MILPLEKLVVSRELAEKMKGLGFPQETCFYWCPAWNGIKTENYLIFVNAPMKQHPTQDRLAAPTSGEIGKLIPWHTILEKTETGIWECMFNNVNGDTYPAQCADTEAEARGLMWCYLKERGLI